MAYTKRQLKAKLSKAKQGEAKRAKQSRLKHAGRLTRLWDRADREAVLKDLLK